MSAFPEIEALLRKLETHRAKLLAAVGRLHAADFDRPQDDGWSAQDILAHLAAAEELNVKFAKMMLAQESPVQLVEFAADYPDYAGPFSLDDFNAYLIAKLRSKSTAVVLKELDDARAQTVAWVETLTPHDLDRGGQHAVWGDQTIKGMLRILALHDKVHTNDISKRASRDDR